jgi:hypothetical protein
MFRQTQARAVITPQEAEQLTSPFWRGAMSEFKVRALRAALVVPLLMGSALVASAGHASASINPDNVDRPKISAGDRDFGNKDIFGILSGGIVNWDETDPGTRSMCPKLTP